MPRRCPIKVVALPLALIYLATNVAFAHKPETSLWQSRREQLARLPNARIGAASALLNDIPPARPSLSSRGRQMVPRGVPHAFMVTSEVARLLAFQTPGSSEPFYRGASEPALADGEGSVDVARVKAMAKETGATEMLGPPPFEPT